MGDRAVKCIACGRSLTRAAFTMPSRNGLLAWGPKCGAELVRQRRKPAKTRDERPIHRDGLTVDLFAEARA